MTIKQQGGIFGRNPTFNDLTVEGSTSLDTLTVDGQLSVDGNVLKVDAANNRVGVNIDSPATSFHSVGTIRTSNNASSTWRTNLSNNQLETNVPNFYFDSFVVGGNFVWRVSNASVGDTTAMTLTSSGNLAFKSGKGIDFSATSGTGTSELFDDYEEGTWTPAQGSGLTVVGSFSSSGTYTKIGRQVTVTFKVAGSTSIAVSAGGIITNNLPFTVLSGINAAGTINRFGAAGGECIGANAGVLVYNGAAISAGGGLDISISYFV
jgi:hypothetical protein